ARGVLRPRVLVYGLAFLLVTGTLGASLARRSSFEANILRPRGANPFVVDGEVVRNAFEIHLVNKAPGTARFEVEVESPVAADIVVGTPEVELASLADARVPVSVSIPRRAIGAGVVLEVEVKQEESGEERKIEVRFLAPFGAPPG